MLRVQPEWLSVLVSSSPCVLRGRPLVGDGVELVEMKASASEREWMLRWWEVGAFQTQLCCRSG